MHDETSYQSPVFDNKEGSNGGNHQKNQYAWQHGQAMNQSIDALFHQTAYQLYPVLHILLQGILRLGGEIKTQVEELQITDCSHKASRDLIRITQNLGIEARHIIYYPGNQ